jgi:hypothetical protein
MEGEVLVHVEREGVGAGREVCIEVQVRMEAYMYGYIAVYLLNWQDYPD